MERHGLRLPTTTLSANATGRLSPMAFLVGVNGDASGDDTPTRCVQRLSAAVVCVAGSELSALNRGRMALPHRGGGEGRCRFAE